MRCGLRSAGLGGLLIGVVTVPVSRQRQRHLGEQGDGDLYVARAAGSYLFDTRGKRYVDFVTGWCVGTFADRCRKNGLLVASQSGGVLLLPALNIDRRTASRGLDILEQSA